MGYFCFRKICAAAARLAAALVLFGGSLVGGEALLAAAGGGNVAHAQAPTNLQMAWSNTDNNMIGGTFTWTPGSYAANWQIEVRTSKFQSTPFHSTSKTSGAGGSHTFADNVFTRGTRYWIRINVEQTDGGNSSNTDINLNWLAPQLVLAGAAVSINATYGHSDDFDVASVTLTWGKDSNDVIGWDIEVREGACSGQSCTAPLVTSLTAAAAARAVSFPGISFSRGLPYSFRIRGKNSERTSDWANHTLSVAFSGTPAKFTMGWSADAVTNTTFGGTLRWNFAALHNLAAWAVYQGRCSGAECVSDNLIYDSGGGHAGIPFAPPAGDRRQVFAPTTFARGTEYTFKFAQGGVGSVVETLSYFRAPGTPVVAQAISVGLVFAGGDGFDQAATLTWQKDYNDATGWEIEVREGTCVTVDCSTSRLVTTFTLAATATIHNFDFEEVKFARGIQYSFRIRGRLSVQTGDWHNNNMGSRGTPPGRSGAIDAFKIEWWQNPQNPTLYGGRYRWNGPPTDDKWGLAVYPRSCTGGGPSRCQANQSAAPIFDTGNVHGSAADNSSNSVRTHDFALTTFTAGQTYTFLLMQGNSPGGLHRQLAAPGGVAQAVSVTVSFGAQITGNLSATLTWEKSAGGDLTRWEVEVREGTCVAEDCSVRNSVAYIGTLAANVTSQTFGSLFARGTLYSFRIRGYNGEEKGSWHNSNMGLRATPAVLAEAQTPALRGMYAGVSLYLVKVSVNSLYVARYNDGGGETTMTFSAAPASVSVGGGFFAASIPIRAEAQNAVLVTIWGAYPHNIYTVFSGASLVITARGVGGRIAPTTIRAITVTPTPSSFTDIVFEWDRPANDGGGPVLVEISYGGTLTVFDSINSDGVAPRRAITLSSPVFGAAKHANTSIDEIAVTLLARNGDSNLVSQQTVFNVAADSNGWPINPSDPDPEILTVVAAVESDNIYFYVYMDVGGKSEPTGLRIVRAGTNFSGIDTSTHTNANYRLNYLDPGWPPNPVNAFKNIVVGKIRPGKGDIPGGAQVDTTHAAADYPSGTVSVRFYASGTRNGSWKGFYYEVFSTPGALAVTALPGGRLLQIMASAADDGFLGDGNGTLPLNYEYIHPIGGNTIAFSTVGAANFAVTGLENGETYTVSVRYSNQSGAFSSWSAVTAIPAQPGPPEIIEFLGFDSRVSAAATNVVSLRWKADFKGSQGAKHVELSHRGAMQTIEYSPVGGYHNHTVTVGANRQNQALVYTILASSTAGVSEAPATATLFVSLGAPSAPLSLAVTANGEGSLSLSWSAPNNIGGATITGYLVYVNATVTATVAAASTSLQLSGVAFAPNGREYNIGVAAANPRGIGATAAAAATAIGKPGAPQSLVVAGGANIAVFEWTAAGDGGSELLGYSIAYATGGADTAVSIAPAATRHTVSGLGNGVYTYTLFAFNALGNGAGATAANITSATGPPLAPHSVGVSPGVNQIGITWGVDSTTPNGSAITAFLLYSDDTTMAVATLSDAAATTYTFMNLTEIKAYTLGVAAQSALSLGARRNFVATPLAVPGAPAMFVATPGFRQISLAWDDANSFGGPINAFYLSGTGLSGTVSLATSVTSTVITGLTTGVEYAFVLRASNDVDIGIAATATATPTPGVPQNLMVESILNSVSLSWQAAADDSNDPNITYAVFVNDPLNPVAQDLTGTVYYFTGLTVGSTVTVGVAARNQGGGSSVTLIPVTVYGAPAAPQISIVLANQSVILLLTAPADTGGLSITGYDVVYGIAAEEARTTVSRGAAGSIVIDGLTNDTAYSFVVNAKNRLGGGASVAATATPQSAAPLYPDSFQAERTAITGEISLSWGGGTNNNGSPIDGFIPYLNGTATTTLAATARFHIFTGLMRGQTYTVALAAKNSSTVNAGIGLMAKATLSPLGAPGAPGSFAGNAQFPTISFSWVESEPYNGGGLRYVINGATVAGVVSHELTVTVTGVYAYTIYAVNDVGITGDMATTGVTVAAIKPKAPVLAAPQPSPTLATGISIGWSAPANNGGASITAYIVYVNSVAAQTVGGDATYYLLTVDEQTNTLEYGEAYAIGVAAQNSVGIGVTAAAVGNLLSAPGAPQNFRVAEEKDGQIVLLWDAARPNGATVINYFLARDGATETLPASARGYTVRNLQNGVTYGYSLYANNSEGAGATATAGGSPGRKPGAAGGFRVSSVDENGVATVMWAAPSDNGGRNISGYSFRYIKNSLAATTPSNSWQTGSANAGETVKVFSGLEASVVYRFSLQAVNSFGGGAWVGAQSGGNQAAELDKAILPVAAAALSRQWSQAINQRLSQVGAVGGGGLQANALGASFGKGQMERGFAELLRKHGGALANGKELDGAALRNFAFSLGGGAGAGATGGGMGAGYSQLLNGGGIWGGASYTNMENQRGETPWEGDNIAYYAGIDRAMDADRRLLAGVMFAHNRLETSYTRSSDNSAGEYNLRATGAHPYLLWKAADNASRLWATFGYGAGEVEFAEANQAKTTRDAKIYSASGGFRRNLWSNAKGAEVDGQADFAVANIEVENPGEANSKAGSKNFRALLEARNRVQMANGGEASPFMRAGFRHQSDDVASKSGWEFAAGWRWNAKGGGWNGEVSGGAAGLSGGYKEWNANAMLRKNDAGGKGLWLTLRPQYGVNGGNPVAASGDFWRAMQVKDNKAKNRAASLSLDVGYGLFGASALWRPFVGATIGARAGEYRAGAKWESRLRADMGMSAGVFAKRKPAAADQMQVNFAVAY